MSPPPFDAAKCASESGAKLSLELDLNCDEAAMLWFGSGDVSAARCMEALGALGAEAVFVRGFRAERAKAAKAVSA
jgi:hypothetical protein